MSLLKTTHASSKAAQSAKLRRLGAVGNLKMARKGESAPRKYATGGAVDSGPVDGAPAKPRLDRPGRKMGKGKDTKKGTNVNVIIMQKPDGGGAAGPKPDMPMPGPHPMPGPPPGAGPGGPPMPPPPMKAHGGAVGRYATGGRISNLGKYAHGGKVKRADGGWTGEGDSGKAMKEKSAEDSDKASALNRGAKSSATMGVIGAGVGATGPKMRDMGAVGRTLKGGTLGGAAANLGFAALQKMGSRGKERDAAEASKAGDEAEGRKRGGSINKGKC